VEGFHADIYPDCLSGEVSCTLDEWKSGANNQPIRKPINTLENKWHVVETNVVFEKKEEPKKSMSLEGMQQQVSDLEKENSHLANENKKLKETINSLITHLEQLKGGK